MVTDWNSEISKAQDRLTDLLQDVYASYPQYREIVRMILSTVGRGGEGDVGQRIRDEILVIQVHKIFICFSLVSLPISLLSAYALILSYVQIFYLTCREIMIVKVE